MGQWQRKTFTYLCQALCIWTLGTGIVNAADIWVDGTDIYYSGDVRNYDVPKLRQIINTHQYTNRVVIVDSPGGHLYAGIQMGQMIRNNGLETHLIGSCSSACNHIFAGGFFRDMNTNAKLGLHIGGTDFGGAGYISQHEIFELQRKAASTMMDRVRHYLLMGISIDVLEIMATKNIYQIRWMYRAEAKRLNFVNR